MFPFFYLLPYFTPTPICITLKQRIQLHVYPSDGTVFKMVLPSMYVHENRIIISSVTQAHSHTHAHAHTIICVYTFFFRQFPSVFLPVSFSIPFIRLFFSLIIREGGALLSLTLTLNIFYALENVSMATSFVEKSNLRNKLPMTTFMSNNLLNKVFYFL